MHYKHLLGISPVLAAGAAGAQPYGPGMMWGDGWYIHGAAHFVWWSLVVIVVGVLLYRRRAGSEGGKADRSIIILRERYARGEISKAEYDACKRDLMD